MSHRATGEVGVIGSGSMGRGMALLYSEKGNLVHLYDINKDAPKSVMKEAKETEGLDESNIKIHEDLSQMMSAFKKGEPRLIIMSLPHGKPIDDVLDQLEGHLNQGDIIIDGANEHYRATERRQERAKKIGVSWIGMGVSGGYQASRRGPSMSPGGDKEAYLKVEHLLKDWAAKDKDGNAAVEWVGPGAAGHYVKMLHNGIEQGELSVLAEAYTILHHNLDLSNAEIKDIFLKWNEQGELSDNFLVELGAVIVDRKEGDGLKDEKGIVDDIDDKVTQDVDDSEGTGVWTVSESSLRHISAPTIATAHFLRLVSAKKGERVKVKSMLKIPQPTPHPDAKDKARLIEQVRLATYGSILCSFIQGMNILAKASSEFGWDVPMDKCIKIWRAGCIIRSGYISDILQPIYEKEPKLPNLMLNEKICAELQKCFPAMKEIVLLGVKADAVIPAISASLEYIKSVACDEPTGFEEAQLDAFGDHMFDWRKEEKMEAKKGSHHVEWRKA